MFDREEQPVAPEYVEFRDQDDLDSYWRCLQRISEALRHKAQEIEVKSDTFSELYWKRSWELDDSGGVSHLRDLDLARLETCLASFLTSTGKDVQSITLADIVDLSTENQIGIASMWRYHEYRKTAPEPHFPNYSVENDKKLRDKPVLTNARLALGLPSPAVASSDEERDSPSPPTPEPIRRLLSVDSQEDPEIDANAMVPEAATSAKTGDDLGRRKRRRRVNWSVDLRIQLFTAILRKSAVADLDGRVSWISLGDELHQPPNMLSNHFEKSMERPGFSVAYKHVLELCRTHYAGAKSLPENLDQLVRTLVTDPVAFTRSENVSLPETVEQFYLDFDVEPPENAMLNITSLESALLDECVMAIVSDEVSGRDCLSRLLQNFAADEVVSSLQRLKRAELISGGRGWEGEISDLMSTLTPKKAQQLPGQYDTEFMTAYDGWRATVGAAAIDGLRIKLEEHTTLSGGDVAATLCMLTQEELSLDVDASLLETQSHYDNARVQISMRPTAMTSWVEVEHEARESSDEGKGHDDLNAVPSVEALISMGTGGEGVRPIVEALGNSDAVYGESINSLCQLTKLPRHKVYSALDLLLGAGLVTRFLLDCGTSLPGPSTGEYFALKVRASKYLLGPEGKAPRPWRDSNGMDNERLKDEVLNGVLSLIVSKPGISEYSLLRDLRPAGLKQGAISEVLSALAYEGRIELIREDDSLDPKKSFYVPLLECFGSMGSPCTSSMA
eukprot:Plantae.Rhodophyta-Rhodochaete_pulchella.ctg12689.p1 GENE.Plantae.Rhodophyta-Rhodochaete_pulchella.ctg12689~~Plantae.Rhodophyta-Rhodochaete_pulchella.ctg12689.p1  ORF type:complete len:731 (-),score=120.10 Plantae.Rhodophyta-Rhodochaete_pulchella.ctg12689:1281-3473(-)